MSLSVQIYWSNNVGYSIASAEVLSSLNSWLDSWLDQGSFQDHVTIQFRGADDEVFDFRLGEGTKDG
jgi:hypothetical protein